MRLIDVELRQSELSRGELKLGEDNKNEVRYKRGGEVN